MLLYEDLPRAVWVDGDSYPIITDFREWVKLIDLLKDKELGSNEKAVLILQWYSDKQPSNIKGAIEALSLFAQCKSHEEPEKDGESAPREQPVFSYSHDINAILAGFQAVYGIDLLSIDYLHWWQFRALLDGLPEDTDFKRRVYYRSVNLAEIESAEERKRIAKIKRMIALPDNEFLTDEDIGSAFW